MDETPSAIAFLKRYSPVEDEFIDDFFGLVGEGRGVGRE
jgi:hypothetical protein